MTNDNQPEQTIIPEVAKILNEKKDDINNNIVITISFNEINEAIEIFNKSKKVLFNPQKMTYYVDGIEFSSTFLNETISKFSQYINAASNMMYKARIQQLSHSNNLRSNNLRSNNRRLNDIKQADVLSQMDNLSNINKEKKDDIEPTTPKTEQETK